MATSFAGGDGGECGSARSFGGRRPQCDPIGKLSSTPPPNLDGLSADLDSNSLAGGKVVVPPLSPYAEEADKGVVEAEKAAARAHSMGEEVSPFAPSPPR
ncbi:hypothetical protein D1007_08710 [Hordeum vulgare]|nr:hypothetical protein D1007_08710 [Hordeum vulgare]